MLKASITGGELRPSAHGLLAPLGFGIILVLGGPISPLCIFGRLRGTRTRDPTFRTAPVEANPDPYQESCTSVDEQPWLVLPWHGRDPWPDPLGVSGVLREFGTL